MDDERSIDGASRQAASDSDAMLMADRRRAAALRFSGRDDRQAVAPADESAEDEVPLFEATTSALGGDVDAAGNRLVVWPDRVELQDGTGRVQSVIAVAAIEQVQVRRRLTSATLMVTGRGGERLVLKGVKPAAAAQFRDTVASLTIPTESETASTSTSEELRRLEELAAMGLLTPKEVAEKRSQLAHRSERPPR